MRSLLFVRSAAFALLALSAACHRSAEAPVAAAPAPAAPAMHAPPPAAKVAGPEPGRLPEDPVAAKAAEAQWRQHMEHEEEERQLAFDHNRLKEHRALTKLIAAQRTRLDHARSEAALAKVRADMPAQLAEIQRRVTEIDHWGNNSRLLPDYAFLSTMLAGAYADAKLSAIKGDAHALQQVRAGFDQHMKSIADWLEEAAESEGE